MGVFGKNEILPSLKTNFDFFFFHFAPSIITPSYAIDIESHFSEFLSL